MEKGEREREEGDLERERRGKWERKEDMKTDIM